MSTAPPLSPEVLGESQLFAGLSSAALSEVVACGQVRHLDKGMTIFVQGAPAERAHVLLEGRARILQTDEDGAQVVMRFIGPGETFGTMALFTDHLYPAHAIAIAKATEISWPEASLLDLMARHPQIGLNLVRVIGARLRETEERLRELATQRVERRIAHTLLRLAAQAGKAGHNGTEIDFPLSRKDLAEMCGATLHTVSRTLTAWEKQGIVRTSQQRITIPDIREIQKRCEEERG